MNYSQTLDFLFGQLPMYQRIGAAAYKSDLNNTIEICNILGNPQDAFKSIHVAGTNGKGSVSHLLASVLQDAGYKTGLYTSPHLKDFRERIRINGEMVPREFVAAFVEEHKEEFGHIRPSFFEYTFGMAMSFFAMEKVDFAVLETGMGGRLDSTNVVSPLLSVITNIGMDHSQFLGDSLEKIAREKAGIIKPGIPAVIGETRAETEPVFREVAAVKNAPLYFADQQYRLKNTRLEGSGMQGYSFDVEKSGSLWLDKVRIPFRAAYQLKNSVTALAALDQLSGVGIVVGEKNVRQGMEQVITNTGLAGRWQILQTSPLTICDTGHNAEGIREVVAQLAELEFKVLHIVLGAVDDKLLDDILQQLPADAIYYFCKADIPRGLDAEQLKLQAARYNLVGQTYPSVKNAFDTAIENAAAEDAVFVGGSTFVVAEVL